MTDTKKTKKRRVIIELDNDQHILEFEAFVVIGVTPSSDSDELDGHLEYVIPDNNGALIGSMLEVYLHWLQEQDPEMLKKVLERYRHL